MQLLSAPCRLQINVLGIRSQFDLRNCIQNIMPTKFRIQRIALLVLRTHALAQVVAIDFPQSYLPTL